MEQAFKVFERALKLQKNGEFEAANKFYDELFEIDVITNDSHSGSPTIRTLRYLAHRNRGLLHFDELRSQISEISPDEALEQFFNSLDDLIEALQHSEGDIIVINLLLSLFTFFGNDRLSRFLIEYELSKDENDEMYLHERSKLLSPNFQAYLSQEKMILAKINCTSNSQPGQTYPSDKTSFENLAFLKPLKLILDERHSNVAKSYSKTITIEKLSWKSIALKIGQQISRSKLKSHKFKDGYQLLESPIVLVKFTLPSDEAAFNDQEQICDKLLSEKSSIENDIDTNEPEQTPTQIPEELTDGNQEKETPQDNTQGDNALKRVSSEGQIVQRASKRFRQQTESEPDTNNIDEFQYFYDNFKKPLEMVGLTFRPITTVIGIKTTSSDDQELFLKDFYSCLDNWTSRHSEFLSFNSSKGQNGLALSELINTNITNSSIASDSCTKDFGDELVGDFLTKINTANYHFCEVRFLFLMTLMASENGTCPIIDHYFDKELYSAVEDLLFSSEADIFTVFQEKYDRETLTASVTILEMFINSWINLRQKTKIKGLSSKVLSELNYKIDYILDIVKRWEKLVFKKLFAIGDEVLLMRARWCSVLFLQHEQKIPVQYLKLLLHELYQEFESNYNELTVDFPNYESIPALSVKMIKNQSDKLNVLTTFEKTLSEQGSETSEVNTLLETVLLTESTQNFTDEERSMLEFISGSSINLKLKLWKILLDSYLSSLDVLKYQKGLCTVLPLLLEQVTTNSYIAQSDMQRQQILLNTIGFYGDYIDGFALILEKNNWHVEYDGFLHLFQSVVEFIRVLLCFNLHDISTASKPFHELAHRSSSKLRHVTVNSMIVIFCFYNSNLSKLETAEIVTKYDFFNVIHEQIGSRGFCDSASGRFLRLSQFIWKNADPDIFESDILQHLFCRFHICISSERFNPSDHHTIDSPFDKSSAVAFAPCLMNLIMRKRDPLFGILKPDLKTGLDLFSKAVGEPNFTSTAIQKNEANVAQYLDAMLDRQTFKNAFMGSLDIGLKKTALEEQIVADQGLFYSEAVTNLNIYKIRKKAMQSKASDLEDILKMIKADLLYGSDKAESWLLLGQTFALQVEDDLIWTSDKLNVMEKKLSTASTQRKSILSFLMSLSILIRNETRGIENRVNLFALCLSSLSKELYHSLTKPMSGLCFENQLKKTVLTADGISTIPPLPSKFQRKQLFLVTDHIIKMAITIDPKDWLNFFYLAQVLHKLNADPIAVLDTSLRACELNSQGIEPHYQLCSLLYKYVKSSALTEKDAIGYIQRVKTFFGLLDVTPTEDQFNSIIIQSFRKINQIDKKKWHHKHRYKLSTIYYGLQDFEKAYEELESLIILKSTNKNLINIWKPDLEPPGKHFVYTYKYILYYVKLTNCLADFHKLLLFTKKLRRYGAGMINLNEAWDFACTTLCHLTKEMVRAEPGFTDIEVPKLVYVEFVQASQTLSEKYKSDALKDEEIELMTLLYEISEIRRMNNGFGSTSQLDDTFNTIYLKIYLKNVTEESKKVFINQQSVSLTKPNGANIKTKVARRDILAAATTLVRAVEPKLKDFKITDDIGIKVPDDIKERHINEQKKRFEGSTPVKPSLTVGLQKSDSNLESTPTPENNDLIKTPDYKEHDGFGKSNPDSEDEFHTPTNTVFEGEDP